jgi:hypothetical protein
MLFSFVGLQPKKYCLARSSNKCKLQTHNCHIKKEEKLVAEPILCLIPQKTGSVSRLLSKNVKVRIYKPIILPVVLYGCETWSLTIREEHKLRVFESRVLRRIFGLKRDGVMGGWRKLYNEELHNL